MGFARRGFKGREKARSVFEEERFGGDQGSKRLTDRRKGKSTVNLPYFETQKGCNSWGADNVGDTGGSAGPFRSQRKGKQEKKNEASQKNWASLGLCLMEINAERKDWNVYHQK